MMFTKLDGELSCAWAKSNTCERVGDRCVAINACVNDRAKELVSTWPLSRRDVWAERKKNCYKRLWSFTAHVRGRWSLIVVSPPPRPVSPTLHDSHRLSVLQICGEFFSLIVCAKNPKRSWSKNFFLVIFKIPWWMVWKSYFSRSWRFSTSRELLKKKKR